MFEALLILGALTFLGFCAFGVLLAALCGRPGALRGTCGIGCGLFLALLFAGGVGTTLAFAAVRGGHSVSHDWHCDVDIPSVGSPFQGMPRGLRPPTVGPFSPFPDIDVRIERDFRPGKPYVLERSLERTVRRAERTLDRVGPRLERGAHRLERQIERGAHRLERRLERSFDRVFD